jgi:hypothetical protein
MSIVRNRTMRSRDGIFYGLASALDAVIMIGSFGFLLATYRQEASLWLARRDMRKRKDNK